MKWVGEMKRAVDETYPEQKWRDYFHGVIDQMVAGGAKKGETAE